MEKAKLQERYQLFIGGQWKDASAHETFKTICPADGSVLAECAQATKEDVDEAVKAAWEAFKTWKHTTVAERAAVLNKIAAIIDENKEHLAMVESMDNGKPIPATLELGGKSANIFFEDCDWEMAMDGLQMGILFNQGQVCCAGSRVFVQESIYDRFVEEAVKRFNKVKVGLPWKEETQMGSQIDRRQMEKILKYVEIGKEEGAKVLCGGVQAKEGELEKGCFLRPTLLGDVTNDMRVAQEEIFGPVACIIKFKTEEEVLAMANDSAYGLGGAVWTRDINRALRVARGVETGRMWVNTYNAIPEGAPFGGCKASGIGRETHKVILEHYTQMKNIMINMAEAPTGFYPA